MTAVEYTETAPEKEKSDKDRVVHLWVSPSYWPLCKATTFLSHVNCSYHGQSFFPDMKHCPGCGRPVCLDCIFETIISQL